MDFPIYDVLVLGVGAGGCAAALRAADLGARVLLVTKGDGIADSNTAHAQGGIIARGEEDSPELLEQDVLPPAMACAGRRRWSNWRKMDRRWSIRLLIDRLHVAFTRQDGELEYTQEAAHSTRRILFAADATGPRHRRGLVRRRARRIRISPSGATIPPSI